MVKKRLIFVGGGSGGHINPLLAVMEALQRLAPERGVDVHCIYLGLSKDIHSSAITSSPLEFEKHAVTSGKLNRFLTWQHVVQAGNLVAGLAKTDRLLGRLKPDLVFSKGGYVSLPTILAAARRKIPVYCHETDVVPGLANRWAARFATTIFTAFPAEFYAVLPKEKLKYAGQPVRSQFYTPPSNDLLILNGHTLREDLPLITVIGASQGAHRINILIQAAWARLLGQAQVVHVTGPADYPVLREQAEKLPAALRHNLVLTPFIQEELPEVFKRSTLIVSRSGGTIAELAAVGAPSILLPLSTAAQNHQWANAQVLARANAALLFDEEMTTSEELRDAILDLLSDAPRREALSAAIRQFAHPEAATVMAETLLKGLHGK